MRIKKEEAAGLLIDVQEKLMPHISNNTAVVERIIVLLKGLAALDIPLVASEQYRKGLGYTLEEVRNVLPRECTFEKISFSCCDEPLFYRDILPKNKKFVIIAGVEAHVCVLQTVIDLLEAGYVPVVVEDCVSSRRERDKSVAMQRMLQSGAIITTCESLLFELCRYAGSETFKNISRLVK